MKDRILLFQKIREALLTAFPDPSSARVQKDIEWALKRWAKEAEFTIDFLEDGEYPEIGVLCHTPDATYEKDTENMSPPDGFLWQTNRRMMFVCKTGGGLFKTANPLFLEFSFSSLTSIKHSVKGTFFKDSWIVLYVSTTSASGKVVDISFQPHGICTKEAAAKFVTNVQEYQKQLNSSSVQNSSVANPQENLLAALERLTLLRQQNHLSEEEFNVAKKKLLNG